MIRERGQGTGGSVEHGEVLGGDVAELLDLLGRESGVDVHVEMGVAGESNGFVGVVGRPRDQVFFRQAALQDGSGKLDVGVVGLELEAPLLAVDVDADVEVV